MSTSFEIDPILRLSAGAVGEPGDRTFYIQARSADQLVTFLVEKEQVRALAVSIQQMLAAIPDPETVEEHEGDVHELEEPLLPEWRVGPMALQYDEARDRIVLVANELIDPEAGGEAASARLVATREQARGLAEQAERVVDAGRPQCRFCGFPMDAGGHMCAAMNGHRDMEEREP
jgi:uncharacterized repeat protein (TIGR03847 family)